MKLKCKLHGWKFYIKEIYTGFEVIRLVCINNHCYELIEERKSGFNEEAFKNRYSDILTKYDYIVGDWGYGQLRLRGFFDDHNQKSSFDT